MRIIPKQLVACTGVAALSAVGLFATVSHAQKRVTNDESFVTSIETVLSLSPSQKDTADTAIQQAQQQAQPVRQQLMNTRKSLEAAVRSDDTAQIQRLATVEGQEIGQLSAIHSNAVAKVYKTLTPDQKTRADALQQLLMPEMEHGFATHHRAAS